MIAHAAAAHMSAYDDNPRAQARAILGTRGRQSHSHILDPKPLARWWLQRWQMPRCHAFGVLLTICFIGSVRAQCGVPSVSAECSAGRWLDISTGDPFQCTKCTPISCRLQSSPTGGDTISHGTLSVVPTSGRLDNVDKDGSDHVVFGAMVY